MQKKLLPFLQKLKELKLPRIPNFPNLFSFFARNKTASSSTTTTIAPDFVTDSPEQYSDLNLIVNNGGNPLANIKYDRILVLVKFLTVLNMVVFMLFVYLNQTLTSRLEKEKSETDRLYNNIREYDATVEKTRSLSRRIQFYKKILKDRSSLATKTRLISSIANEQVDIVKVVVTKSTFSISTKGSNALMFAQILETYTSSKIISEIRLKSARLIKEKTTNQNGFAIELEGNFK
jgi:hypothetical protein